MTILEVAASSRIGGVETYLLRLAQHLRSHHHRVLFMTRRDVPLARKAHALGFSTREEFRGGKNLLTVWKLARLMRRESVDVVHTHLFSAHSLGALAARIAGIPSVARAPATESAQHYRYSTYVTSVSYAVARHLEGQGVLRQNVQVFYNGVSVEHFDALPPQSQARHQFGLPDAAFVVLCLASLTPRKGHRFLLEAVAQLPSDTHLLLCGEGKEEGALRALVEQLRLQQRTLFAGFLPDVRPALAASDAFVLPSLHEGLPNVVLEALAARVPTVATNVAGTPEVIENEISGFLAAPGQIEPLSAALRRLHDEADLRSCLATHGRQTVETRFDGTRCLNQIEVFLERVVEAWQDGRRLVEPEMLPETRL